MLLALQNLVNLRSNNVSVALTGQSETVSQGSLTPSFVIPLSGSAESLSAGNLSVSVNKALTGLGITENQGSLVANIVAFLSGQVETYSQGTLTPDTGFLVALTGQSEIISQGSLSPSVTVSLVGGGETISQGTFTVTRSQSLTGQSETLTQGALAASLVAQIIGQQETENQGTLTPVTGTSVALTGQFETFLQGVLGVVITDGGIQPIHGYNFEHDRRLLKARKEKERLDKLSFIEQLEVIKPQVVKTDKEAAREFVESITSLIPLPTEKKINVKFDSKGSNFTVLQSTGDDDEAIALLIAAML